MKEKKVRRSRNNISSMCFLSGEAGFLRFEVEAEDNNQLWLSIQQKDPSNEPTGTLKVRSDEVTAFIATVARCLALIRERERTDPQSATPQPISPPRLGEKQVFLPVRFEGASDEQPKRCVSCAQSLDPQSLVMDEPDIASSHMEQQKAKHARAYAPWDAEEEEELAFKWRQTQDIAELSEHFGRNQGAIRSRLRKLGLLS